MSAAHTGPFSARFDQLAFYENGRTPILLLEDEYNRAKLCWETHDALVEALQEVLQEAVILSDEYLATFERWPADKTIQGWDKARWLRASAAAKKARAALRAATLEAAS